MQSLEPQMAKKNVALFDALQGQGRGCTHHAERTHTGQQRAASAEAWPASLRCPKPAPATQLSSFGRARDSRPPKQISWLRSGRGVGVWAKGAQETPCTCLRPLSESLAPPFGKRAEQGVKEPAARLPTRCGARMCARNRRAGTDLHLAPPSPMALGGRRCTLFLLRRVVSTASTVEP